MFEPPAEYSVHHVEYEDDNIVATASAPFLPDDAKTPGTMPLGDVVHAEPVIADDSWMK